MNDPSIPCGLCLRVFERKQLTRHHCLPKSKGGTNDDIELICSMCHSFLHTTYTNSTLAQRYGTLDQLRLAPEIQPFLRWVKKQPPTRRTPHDRRRRRI